MAYKKETVEVVELRKGKEFKPERMPDDHRICLSVLIEACMDAGVGFYVGKWTRSGYVKVTFYVDGRKLESFLDIMDEPAKWLEDHTNSVLGSAYVPRALGLAEARIGRTVSKAPKAGSGSNRPPGTSIVP